MASESIPENFRVFLSENVRSLMAVELLLLIHTQPNHEWNVDELARELRAARDWTDRECQFLAERSLVVCKEGRIQYQPGSTAHEEAVRWLASAYPERRYSIIQVIFATPSEPIQSFADAFRLRKDKTDG